MVNWLAKVQASDQVKFHDNQVECFSPGADPFVGVSTLIAAAGGDALVSGNQFACEIRGPRMAANVYAHGATLRVLGNRFGENLSDIPAMEVEQRRMLSAVTWSSLLNNTTSNQATHCIHASSARPNGTIQAANQVLVEVLGIGSCAREIKGRVVLDGKPVGGVVVAAYGVETKAITDNEGRFRISVPQNAVVLTSTYGQRPHKSVTVSAETDAVEIPLGES